MKKNSVKSGIMKVAIIGVVIMVVLLVFNYVMQVRQQRSIEQLARADRNNL